MIDYPNRIVDIHVRDKLRELIDAINSSQATISSNSAAIRALSPPLTLAQIKAALQLGGSSPINVTGLQGTLANPQISVQSGLHATRLVTPVAVGSFFVETDRTVLYAGELISNKPTWVWAGGCMIASRASYPSDLGAHDAGFNLYINDYAHLAIWDGTAWRLTDGGGGYFVDSAIVLGTGYQLCDGSATDYITNNTTNLAVTPFTTPDETTANPGTYHTSAAAYTGTINAATTPTFTGNAATLTGTVSQPTFSGNAATLTGTVTSNSFTVVGTGYTAGATAAALTSFNGTVLVTGNNTANTPNPTLSMNSYTPSGTVSQPTLTMNSYTPTGTISISGGAPVKNMGVLRYFRR